MTDEGRGPGDAMGPPWSIDLLADLHAGVLDAKTEAKLWPRVEADPDAQAIIEALRSTTTELGQLSAAPAPPMPAMFAARLDAAIAEEARRHFGTAATPPQVAPSHAAPPRLVRPQAPPPRPQLSLNTPPQSMSAPAPDHRAPVIDIAAIKKRRGQRTKWGVGILAVAAAAIAALVIVIPNSGTSGGPIVAEPTPSQGSSGPPLALRADGSNVNVAQVIGVTDLGPLQNQQRLNACLVANGLDPAVKPIGIRPVTVEGQSGVVVILTTGVIAQFRLVAFSANCGADNPGKLFDRVVGG